MTAIIFPNEYLVDKKDDKDLIIDHRDLFAMSQTRQGKTIISFQVIKDNEYKIKDVEIDLRIWEVSCIIADCIRGENY